ncbi:MAG: CxxxxCH/CxxCH domain-containing protein [Nitrospiraceae bacterium]|nr:MAG: CxxxxCH/CxxCH domain-containing protein [Nitrospiraceae bacterium]
MNTIIRILLVMALCFFSAHGYALDFPHNGTEGINCESCHYVWGSQPSLMIEGLTYGQNGIDDTEYNQLCWSCHWGAMGVNTHSSYQTDNSYGDWTVECRVCHNPHGHKQFRTYGSASYIYQGVVSSVNATSLTKTGAGWTDNQYQGLILVPNIAQNSYNYKITGNNIDTLTVEGTINLTKVSPGNTFIIVYGSLIREKITTPNSGIKTVRFFNSTGTNSFADGDATYDGVCEVCHTQSTYHKNDVTGNHAHNAGTDCTYCHKHTKGFKIACDICHGYPPTVNTATGGPNGLVNNPGVTGSSTAGAHNVHVNTKGYDCATCHYNSVGTGSTHNNGLSVTLGFYLFNGSYQGGTYNGQSGVTYNATTTAPVTFVSNNNNKTCSNIYCHSTGQSTSSGSSSTPTYASPLWDTPASGVCGTCHNVTGLTSGSHAAHLGTTGVNGCGDCHTGAANNASSYNSANHINALIDVANSYTAGGTPGNGYGTCSTASCHDDATGNLKTTPTWGTPGGGCSECHADVPGTGSHTKHVTTTLYSTAVCGDCHDSAVRGTTPPEQHLDSNIDVYDVTAGDLGYPSNKTKASAYTTCTTAYCHSTGQSTTDGNSATPAYAIPTWGNSASAACGTCHKVTEASGLTSGSHAAHLGTTGVNGCSDCHTGAANDASSYNYSNHVNKSIDVANSYTKGGTPGNGYGTCSAAACHGNSSPTWGTDFTGIDGCTKCHGTPTASPAPAYTQAPPTDTAGDSAATDAQVGAHRAHLQSTISSNVACSECHIVPAIVSAAGHINDATPGTAELIFGALASSNSATPSYSGGQCSNVYCHGGAMPKGTTNGADRTPIWNNTNYLTGNAANDCSRCHGYPPSSLAVHSGKGATDCIICHNAGVNASGTGFTDPSSHINGTVNISDNCNDCHSSKGGPAPGNIADTPHARHVQTPYVGKVSTSDYGKLPNWYSYSNLGGVPNKGCGYCHPQSSATHMNGVINLNLDPNDTGAAGTMKGKNNTVQSYTQTQRVSVTCSSVYCHSSGYFDGSTYQYKSSPNWYGGTFVGDKCDDCHGNMPDTSSHMTHGRIAIHYDTIYNGTNGLLPAGAASGGGHGDPNTSTTINCNLCHNNVVKMAANDKNTVCAVCHAATPVGTMVIDPSATSHVTGTADINFANVIIRSKAQIRDDITTVTELNTYWQRNNGYKQGASSYDSSKATLASQATYSNGTCSNVSCHNGFDITWNTNISTCAACHQDVPRTDE